MIGLLSADFRTKCLRELTKIKTGLAGSELLHGQGSADPGSVLGR